jgi:hypothetical protein
MIINVFKKMLGAGVGAAQEVTGSATREAKYPPEVRPDFRLTFKCTNEKYKTDKPAITECLFSNFHCDGKVQIG